MEENVISIEEAKKVIEQEKQQRGNAFLEEYKALCAKHNCEIQINGLIIVAK